VIEQLISAGELYTGTLYIVIGAVFGYQLRLTNSSYRRIFRCGLCVLFVVGGLEEIGGAMMHHGQTTGELSFHAVLTLMQIVTVTAAAVFIYKAKLFTHELTEER